MAIEFKNISAMNESRSQKIGNSPVLQIFYGMIGAILVLFVMHTFSVAPKQVATIDITGIVNAYVKNLAKANIDPSVATDDIKQFAAQLQNNVQLLSKKKGVVILPSEAVIAGAKDLTPVLIKRMPSIANLEDIMKNEQSQAQPMKQDSQASQIKQSNQNNQSSQQNQNDQNNQNRQNNQTQVIGQLQSTQPTQSTTPADQLGVE